MERLGAERLGKLLGRARIASGVAFIAGPKVLGRTLIGNDADSAGAQLILRAFGARDALLGAGTVLASDEESMRSWLLASGLADAFDASATLAVYRSLPPRRRALTLAVSIVPALLNLQTARSLGRPGAITRWMYRGGRPNRLATGLNRMQAVVAAAGIWPERLATLEVRGRRSGRPVTLPVVVADHGGGRYLVAMLGESSNWVANVRAAGGQAVLHHGHDEDVQLEEVDAAERAPILRRYVDVAPSGRVHLPVDRNAPIEAFEQIAARYPVFRIQPR